MSQQARLPLAAIRFDGDCQSRVCLDEETIAEYAYRMKEGAAFPPITVFFDGAEYWLADGFHRYAASKALARERGDEATAQIVAEADRHPGANGRSASGCATTAQCRSGAATEATAARGCGTRPAGARCLRATTAPLDHLEAAATRRHAVDMRRYKAELKRWKAEGSDPETEPTAPRLARWLVENATVEAISELLRTDGEGRFIAPARKILIRQDELSEWVANLDRYRQGGRGGGDRGAYLRLFNGGRFVIDRVQRGAFAVPNQSACLLGGIQPEVIARIAQEAADDGLLQRFLFAVVAQTEPGEDRPPDAAALERYRALIPALTALNPPTGLDGSVRAVTLAADAHRHRHAVDRLARMLMLLPSGSSRRQAAAGKLPGIFARLALAFHLIGIADARARGVEHPPMTVVRPKTAAMAAAFLTDIAIPNMLAADEIMFGGSGEEDAEWLAGFILGRRVESLTLRDLVQFRKVYRAPERRRALMAALDLMAVFGRLAPEEGRSPFSEPTAWQVNRRVHERFREIAEIERERRRRLHAELVVAQVQFRFLQEEEEEEDA